MQIAALPLARVRPRRSSATLQLFSSLGGGVSSAVIEGVGNTAVSLRSIPRLVGDSVRLARESKTWSGSGLAVAAGLAAVLAPPVVLVASALHGLGRGLAEGLPRSFEGSTARVKSNHRLLSGGLPALERWVQAQLEARNPNLRHARETRELVQRFQPSGSAIAESDAQVTVGGSRLRRRG